MLSKRPTISRKAGLASSRMVRTDLRRPVLKFQDCTGVVAGGSERSAAGCSTILCVSSAPLLARKHLQGSHLAKL